MIKFKEDFNYFWDKIEKGQTIEVTGRPFQNALIKKGFIVLE